MMKEDEMNLSHFYQEVISYPLQSSIDIKPNGDEMIAD